MDRTRRATRARPSARTLADVMPGADIFLGCSAAGVLTPEMVKTMARRAAHPRAGQSRTRRSARSCAKAARPDCIIATGRSDYPNQVNNVLCFPYIFRGALDCGATRITEEMKLACVHAIAELAKAENQRRWWPPPTPGEELQLRPRLHHPEAVRPAPDPAHRAGGGEGGDGQRRGHAADRRPRRLPRSAAQFVYHTGMFMRPVFAAAQAAAARASSMPRARTSACCARCRSCSTKGSPSRS